MKEFLRELRCPDCHSLLLMEYIFSGRIEIKCQNCKKIHQFKFKYTKNATKTLATVK